VSEINPDNANLLSRVTGIYPDNATRVDWKQVFLSDFVFSQKLRLSKNWRAFSTPIFREHSQPNRRARRGRRQSFVLLLQQNHSGLNYRVQYRQRFRSTNLTFHCKNQPFCTQVHGKVPKSMYVVLRTGYCVIMLSNVAILQRHIA